MTSLSNVIKSSHYIPLDSKKIIEAATIRPSQPLNRSGAVDDSSTASHQASDLEQAVRDKQLEQELEQWKEQARREAEEIVQQAQEQAREMLANAEQEISELRAAREEEFQEEMARAMEEAREQAYREGYAKGEEEAKAVWQEKVGQAAAVLQDAHALKQEIISEAEPFLLELSTQIAETIIDKQLTLEPEWVIDQVRSILSRERRRGTITLCVSPEQFPYIREARDELMMVLDSQAELQILPDATIKGYGCVVRTDLGSLDARIDSQLTEIKQALLQVYASEQEVSES